MSGLFISPASMQSGMEKFCLIAFLILLRNITTIGYHVDTHRVAKRMDLESCLGQFDIHRDTIIRTEESQAIGGKYLQGLGLETLEECQRLCCETESCDVYIFEEKAEGYCYLFECGPPMNFRCKFTRHSNYTSAVLTPVRHITPPTTIKPLPLHPKLPSPSLSQHERELTNLKQKPELGIQQTKSTSTAVPPSGNHIGTQITTPKNSQVNTSSCGRFQFKCHSGECIAVYNACDGIPQCEDGSDEGPECPSNSGSKSVGIKSNDSPLINNRMPPEGSQLISKQSPLQSMPRQYQQQIVQVPIINNREDPMSAPQMWPNRKTQDISSDMAENFLADRNSHIFNHKGGIQISTNNLAQQYPNQNLNMYNPMARDMYVQPDIQGPYRTAVLQPQDHMIIGPPNLNWQQQPPQQSQGLIPAANSYVISVNGEPVPQVKPVAVPQEPSISVQSNSVKKEEPLAPETPSTTTPKSKNKHENDGQETKISSEESEEYTDYTEKSTEAPKKKIRKHKKQQKDAKNKAKKEKSEAEKVIEAPVHEKYKMIKEDLEMEFVDHDGQSERPGGAVLSLTLGIIVTAALAVLVGCRMRTVSRRVRRMGKAPYAHEADFLVNGMYL